MYKNFISFKILSSNIGKAPHQYFIVPFLVDNIVNTIKGFCRNNLQENCIFSNIHLDDFMQFLFLFVYIWIKRDRIIVKIAEVMTKTFLDEPSQQFWSAGLYLLHLLPWNYFTLVTIIWRSSFGDQNFSSF